jgi:hypothetical protein
MKIEDLGRSASLADVSAISLAIRSDLMLIGAGVFWALGSVFFWPAIVTFGYYTFFNFVLRKAKNSV